MIAPVGGIIKCHAHDGLLDSSRALVLAGIDPIEFIADEQELAFSIFAGFYAHRGTQSRNAQGCEDSARHLAHKKIPYLQKLSFSAGREWCHIARRASN